MSGIDDLLDGIPIPRMARAAQRFDRPRVADIEGEIVRGVDAEGSAFVLFDNYRYVLLPRFILL